MQKFQFEVKSAKSILLIKYARLHKTYNFVKKLSINYYFLDYSSFILNLLKLYKI